AAGRHGEVASLSRPTAPEGAPAMDPLDRQLADVVNVDPSPEFVARVRVRVATEGRPARLRMFSFLAAGAALATVTIAIWVVRVDRSPSQVTPAVPVHSDAARVAHAEDAALLMPGGPSLARSA